ncbi:hypothetical protein [Nocardia sp. NPDC052566]
MKPTPEHTGKTSEPERDTTTMNGTAAATDTNHSHDNSGRPIR